MNQVSQTEFQYPEAIDEELNWDKTRILTANTDPFGYIEYANQAFMNTCGYEVDEVIGQSYSMFYHPTMPKVIFKIMWDQLKAGKGYAAIIKNLSKSGAYYWLFTEIEVVKNDKGEVLKFHSKERSVPAEIIKKYIDPLYSNLLKIENANDLEVAESYLNFFLNVIQKTYLDYMYTIM